MTDQIVLAEWHGRQYQAVLDTRYNVAVIAAETRPNDHCSIR